MTTPLPEPPVPADADLRAFAYMPLEVNRLLRSRAWLLAKRTPEVGFYMLNLWMAAWHEVPAGSLEDDDDVLCEAARCDAKRWAKVRGAALHGWIKHSDSRLYHSTVTEKVTGALAAQRSNRARTDAARTARDARRTTAQSQTGKTGDDSVVTISVTENVTGTKGERREYKRREESQESPPEPPSPVPARGATTTRSAEPEPWVGWARKVKAVIGERWPNDERVLRLDGGLCRQWHADGYDIDLDVLPIVTRLCGEYRKPDVISSLKYFSAAIGTRHAERIAEQAAGKAPPISDCDAVAKLRATVEAAYRREGVWRDAWPWRPEMGARPDDPKYVWENRA